MNVRDDPVIAVCDKGRFVGGVAGGERSFSIRCGVDGTFLGITTQCLAPAFTVRGEVTDSESASIKLREAKIVYASGGRTVATAFSDHRGVYVVQAEAGTYEVTASHTGYIDLIKTVEVTSSIQVGQGADLAVTKVMPPGTWKAVVSWGPHSRDIDSHTFFGDSFNEHIYWPSSKRGPKTASGSNGVTVKLDRDDVDGWGPETTTFSGVGDCKQKGRCLILFRLKNYTPQDGDMGDSAIHVKVYTGATEGTDWPVPKTSGSKIWWPLFTIDARTKKIYAGARRQGPYVTNQVSLNWYASTGNTWSKTPDRTLLAGMRRSSEGGLDQVTRALSVDIRSTTKIECTQTEVSSHEAGWKECPAGTYLNGFLRLNNHLGGLECCKIQELPESYGDCTDIPIQTTGWTQCNAEDDWGYMTSPDTASAMVAFEVADQTGAMTKARCCQMPDMGLLEGGASATKHPTIVNHLLPVEVETTSSWGSGGDEWGSDWDSSWDDETGHYSSYETIDTSYSSSWSYGTSDDHRRRRSYTWPSDDGDDGGPLR